MNASMKATLRVPPRSKERKKLFPHIRAEQLFLLSHTGTHFPYFPFIPFIIIIIISLLSIYISL